MTSITIGPAIEIGGNVVEKTIDGKFQVTNHKGKIKTLSHDEFSRNMFKNADKLDSGEEFEFKKDYKGLKIAFAAISASALTMGVVYRKKVGNFLKELPIKQTFQKVKDFFKSGFERTKNLFKKKSSPKTNENRPVLGQEYINKERVHWVKKYVADFEKSAADTHTKAHFDKQKEYDELAKMLEKQDTLNAWKNKNFYARYGHFLDNID